VGGEVQKKLAVGPFERTTFGGSGENSKKKRGKGEKWGGGMAEYPTEGGGGKRGGGKARKVPKEPGIKKEAQGVRPEETRNRGDCEEARKRMRI